MMESLLQAPWARVGMFLTVMALVLTPSALAIHVFAPTTFEALDFGKLLLLSAGIGLPVVLVNSFVLLFADSRIITGIKKLPLESKAAIFTAVVALMAILPMYLPIVWHVFTGLGGLRTAIIIAGLATVLQGIWVGAMVYWCSPCPEDGDYGADMGRGLVFIVPLIFLLSLPALAMKYSKLLWVYLRRHWNRFARRTDGAPKQSNSIDIGDTPTTEKAF